MDILLLRFDAPLMSFGGVVVDQHNRTDAFPYRAMIAGLFANALGYTRRDEDRVDALQGRVRYAARLDRPGNIVVDYQTVDLAANGTMGDSRAWTTRGRLEERKGGDASEGTHIRYRHYLADAVVTVAATLAPPTEDPSIDQLERALRTPARPLFLGRKCCIPSAPVLFDRVDARSLREALETCPRCPTRSDDDQSGPLRAVWPLDEGADERTRTWPRVEDRDPHNAIHVGRRLYSEGLVNPPALGATDGTR